MKPFEFGLLFGESLLITDSILLLVIGLFGFCFFVVHSWKTVWFLEFIRFLQVVWFVGIYSLMRASQWLSLKESACSAGDAGLIPGWEDTLEKKMATHSSILAWETPWTEELGRLQSLEW